MPTACTDITSTQCLQHVCVCYHVTFTDPVASSRAMDVMVGTPGAPVGGGKRPQSLVPTGVHACEVPVHTV